MIESITKKTLCVPINASIQRLYKKVNTFRELLWIRDLHNSVRANNSSQSRSPTIQTTLPQPAAPTKSTMSFAEGGNSASAAIGDVTTPTPGTYAAILPAATTSSVSQFYSGRSIFITGGTGFMGKVWSICSEFIVSTGIDDKSHGRYWWRNYCVRAQASGTSTC